MTTATRRNSPHARRGVMALALLVTAAGCAGLGLDGAVRFSAGLIGERVFKPETCQSGQHHGFFGVDLFAKPGTYDSTYELGYGPWSYGAYQRQPDRPRPSVLRVVNDAIHGPLVRVYDLLTAKGYKQSVDFTLANCRRLTVDAENLGGRWRGTAGTLQLQCALADGTKAEGTITFSCR